MRRPERFAESLREEIGEIVGYELSDPRLLTVTVTEVSVSEDLRDAKVYVTVDGSESEVRSALEALKKAAYFVRQQVAMNLDLRHAPQLHFIRDTVTERAARIEELLENVAREDKENIDKEGN
ncbi:MAG: 30S ribosome-binding factor RbfA [Acidobacteriota bacterium]